MKSDISIKPTIFITASLPMMVRNWIRTGVLEKISQKYHVVLLAPFAKDSSFVEKFSTDDMNIEELSFNESFIASSARRLFCIASMRRFLKTYKIDTLFYKEQLLKQSRLFYYVFRVVIGKLNIKGILERIGKAIWRRFWGRNAHYKALYEQYKPVAVLSTHPYLETEWPLLLHAEKMDIPRYAFIHSWDNPTSRGDLPCYFNKIMVWGRFVKGKILEYHPWLENNNVVITGAPQYDLFLKKEMIEPRELFFSRHKLDHGKKLVTFASGGPLFPNETAILKTILSAMQSKSTTCPIQLWIRPYGGSNFESIVSNSHYQDVICKGAPSEFWGAFRIEQSWTGKDEDFKEYINLLYHSDVVICSASTVTLDACVLDRPVVNAVFDDKTKDFMHSVKRSYFLFSHYQPVIRSGAIRAALTPGELIEYLNEYLDNPALHRDTRRSLVNELCGPTDGQTSERLASAIIEMVNEYKL